MPWGELLTLFISAIIIIWLLFLNVKSSMNSSCHRVQPAVPTYMLDFDKLQPVLHVTSDKFLSFGLDTSLLRRMNELPVRNKKFINLGKHLSPAYVRVGGTSADCLIFNQEVGSTDVKFLLQSKVTF